MNIGKTLAVTAASGILVGLLAGCGGESSGSSGSTTPTGAGSAAPADSSAAGKTSCSGAAGGQKTSCNGGAAGGSGGTAAPSKN